MLYIHAEWETFYWDAFNIHVQVQWLEGSHRRLKAQQEEAVRVCDWSALEHLWWRGFAVNYSASWRVCSKISNYRDFCIFYTITVLPLPQISLKSTDFWGFLLPTDDSCSPTDKTKLSYKVQKICCNWYAQEVSCYGWVFKNWVEPPEMSKFFMG